MVEIDKALYANRFMTPQEVLEVEDLNTQPLEEETAEEYVPELADQDFAEDIIPDRFMVAGGIMQENELNRVLQMITTSITRYINERMKDTAEQPSEMQNLNHVHNNLPMDVYILVDLLLKVNEILKEREMLRNFGERIMRKLNFYLKLIIFKLIFMFLLVFCLMVRYYMN